MEAIKSLFNFFYCLISFSVRQAFRISLVAALAVYTYVAVDILKEATKKSPTALNLIYWRDPVKSAVVLLTTIIFLITSTYFNVVSITAYLGLTVLAATIGYRVYAAVNASVNKSEQKNPFQPYLEKNLDLPQDRAHDHVDTVLKHLKDLLNHLRRLFLVEDYVESIKFFLFLWALTYVGEYVSGTTLIGLALVGLFSLPKIYEMYQPQIDNYYNQAEAKVRPALDTARQQLEKVPYVTKQKVQQVKQDGHTQKTE